MEDQCSPLSWGYYFQDESLKELKHSMLYTTLELQTTILSVQEELARKEDEIFQLKNLVTKITRERDEAQEKSQTLILENLMIHQQIQQQHVTIEHQPNMIHGAISSGTTSSEDEPRKIDNSNILQHSSSDYDESFISSPGKDLLAEVDERIALTKFFPENGKFLKAVMEAGPLLQTLLLAGPLPQWQHPPPQLNTIDIPPVTISSSSPTLTPRLLHQDSSLSATNCGGCCLSKKKRVLENNNTSINVDQVSHSPPITTPNKYQKVVHQSSLTNF
ncbi:hypothetical protein Leryth_021384 [Lithospermum erythrorhizon]|nr:hypothetical protein Leryth_021384 [Lithospermum erythrorhizon]